MSCAYLILENGAVFKGESFGFDGEAIGALVFSTGMAGYMETLTDPRNTGQIVLQTFPLIGNYGVISAEKRSTEVSLKAYIVREWCQEPSNFRSEGNLDSFLRLNRIPGLYGVDTRALTRVIRENGTMNAMISFRPELSAEQWLQLRGYTTEGAVSACAEKLNGSADGKQEGFVMPYGEQRNSQFTIHNSQFNIAVWDFGDSARLTTGLLSVGFSIPKTFGHGIAAEQILAMNPDGVALSGGPGDPTENVAIIGEIKKLCDNGIPIFAVGLRHQMLALALGASCVKLPFGHRGANQPVKELNTERVFVTTQNHGYAVAPDSLPENAAISYENINDGTCEGVEYTDIPAFSIQFDPTDEIFEKFAVKMQSATAKGGV